MKACLKNAIIPAIEVKLVASDASPAQISALQKGTIQALIVQKPDKIGYDGVSSAIASIEGKKVAARIDTGVTVVTMKNINKPEIKKLLNPTGNE